MALTGPGLAKLVFAQHLALFPLAINSTRQNAATGVVPHNVPEQFISALCEGYVNALLTMTITDLGAGTLGVPPGIAPPVPFVFPAAPVAVAQFIAQQGLAGVAGPLVAQSFVGNVLLQTSVLGLLQMNPNPLMAIGTGVVSPASIAAFRGVASMTATVAYAGGTGPTTPVAGVPNSGKIL